MISIDGIRKNFGGICAVDACSFDIPQGSITGLIGPNGAGKTTLFNIVSGFVRPDAGRVTLKNRDITGLPPHRLFHRGLVRTFQIPRMFEHMTVLDNLMLVPGGQTGESVLAAWLCWRKVGREERAIRERAEDTLEFLQMTHVKHEYAGNLSGGQKKLVELGRTMMTDARVLLLDEPGAGVNPTLKNKLCDNIRQLNREFDRTVCIIEHDMDVIAELCHPVIVMAEGRVLTQGAMADIRRDTHVQAAYLGSAAERGGA